MKYEINSLNRKFLNEIGDALQEVVDYKGLYVEGTFKGERVYIDCDDENTMISIKINNFNNFMVANVISKMFKDGLICFCGDKEKLDNATDYLQKLLKENKEGEENG